MDIAQNQQESDKESEVLQILVWLVLAAGVLCFFLADGWIDKLLNPQRRDQSVGNVKDVLNEVRMRPRSTLTWLNIRHRAGLSSGDTIFVGAGSLALLDLGEDMK